MLTSKKNQGVLSVLMGLLVLFLLVSLTGPVHAQAAITIDTFDSGFQVVQQQFGGTALNTTAAGTAIGGQRKIAVENFVSGLTSNVTAYSVFDATDSIFQVVAADPTQYNVTVTWDGDSGSANTIDYTGLQIGGAGRDISHIGGVQVADGILVNIIGWDGNDIDIKFTIYTDENNYSVATYPVRGDFSVGAYAVSLCFYEGCFQPGASANGPADFRNVGAIVMEIVSVQQGADITIDLAFADAARDFGDLPDTYTTLLGFPTDQPIVDSSLGGPRHSQGNIYLGAVVSTELNARSPLDGTGDGSTDDGIVPVGTLGSRWQNGVNGGSVEVTWVSPYVGGDACLDGWVNWHHGAGAGTDTFEETTATVNGNTATYDLNDKHVVQGRLLSGGAGLPPYTETITFPVPSDFFDDGSGAFADISLASRWRIYPADAAGNCPVGGVDYLGYIINGEVEDYIQSFTPTAVSLQSFSAGTGSSLPVYGLIGFAALAMVGVVALVLRRERKQA